MNKDYLLLLIFICDRCNNYKEKPEVASQVANEVAEVANESEIEAESEPEPEPEPEPSEKASKEKHIGNTLLIFLSISFLLPFQ